MPTIAVPQGTLTLSGSAPTVTVHDIPSVVYDGVQGYQRWASGTANAVNGRQKFQYFFFTRKSNGSRQTIAKWNGTVPAELFIDTDNLLKFVAGTSGAICSNALATAITDADGVITALVGLDGNVSTLSATRQNTTPGTPLLGTNTPGTAANVDFAADYLIGQNGNADPNLADWLDVELHGAGMGYFYRAATDADVIEEFVDTSTGLPRIPGTSGANYFDGAVNWEVVLKNPAASHLTNSGAGGPPDTNGTFTEGTVPGAYAADFLADSVTVTPAAGSLVLSGAAATVTATDRHTVLPGKADLLLSSVAPVAVINRTVAPGAGSLLLEGHAPALSFAAPHVVDIPQGTLLLSGQAPLAVVSSDVAPITQRGGAAGSGFSAAVDYDEQARIVRELYAEIYGEVEEDSPEAVEVAAVVAEYVPESAPDLPPPSDVDWQAIVDDGRLARVRAALREIERHIEALKAERMADIEDDEDELFLMVA